jgi:hypothetical protein
VGKDPSSTLSQAAAAIAYELPPATDLSTSKFAGFVR